MNLQTKRIVAGISVILGIILIVYGLGDAFGPLLISFVGSYLLFPLIRRLEKRGIHRKLALTIVIVAGFLLFALSVIFIVPAVVSDSRELIKALPAKTASAVEKVEQFSASFGFPIQLDKQFLTEFVTEHTSALSMDALKKVSLLLKGGLSSVIKALLFVLNLFLIPLFFIYVISDFENFSAHIKDSIPTKMKPTVLRYTRLGNVILSGYLRGQLMVALILAVLYSIGLAIVGIPFGFLIGLFTGLMSVIPYVGPILGFSLAMMMAIADFSGWSPVLGILIVFTIVQGLEGFLITPKLVGNKVGLSELATILALIVGGNLFGILGMFLAIPTAALLKTVVNDLRKEFETPSPS